MSESSNKGSEGLTRLRFTQGAMIFEQGADADAAYLIVEGDVEIYRGKGARQVGVATLGRGDILGEMSLIDGQPRTATARALGDVELLVIRPDDLTKRLERLAEQDTVLRRLIDVFVMRLRGQLARHD